MKAHVALVFALLLMAATFAQAATEEPLPADLTLREVAHSRGVRGGDLAEALGLPRDISKEMPLVELNITRPQLDEALQKLAGPGKELPAPGAKKFTPESTIRDIAMAYDLNGKALAHDFGLAVGVDKDTPVAQFGVTQETIDEAITHNLSHEETPLQNLKYPLYAVMTLFALAWLVRFGLGKNPKRRKDYYPQSVYIGVLLFSVIVLGFVLGKSPNPMEGAVKVFKSTVGLYDAVLPKLLALVFFLLLAVVANKAICGWVCPFGALQELVYMIPGFKKVKKAKLPLWVSNSVRALLFAVFLLGLYGAIAPKGFVWYHYVNPFNLFNFDFFPWTLGASVAVYLLVSLFFYRPFCRFICPFGFLSWFVECLSLTRIRIDFDRCIDCGACAKACPLTAAGDRLAKKSLPADCFSCMRCLRVCPTDAIHFRPAWGPPSPPEKDAEQAPS
ncbi:MAG: 4Fe-4S binding protein [Candidatus Lernaella stagnicola]|nr:4Fe-4S binding protein [Candidatus Lernaella stagnicola]